LTGFPSFSALGSLTHPSPLLVRGWLQNTVKEKISLGKGDSSKDRELQIGRELDEIRDQQSDKLNRGEVIEQLKALQEGIQKKVRQFRCLPVWFSHACVRQIEDLDASRTKTKFKSVEEIDAHIRYVWDLCPLGHPLTHFDDKRS
jgi:hypothetical protein